MSGTPEHVIAAAMSEHFHFCDEPRMTDCGECRRVIATATRIYQALDTAGLLATPEPRAAAPTPPKHAAVRPQA